MASKRTSAFIGKIAPPRLASTFARPRLFRLLDSARKRTAIWICAPAGFGKTTLVASYIATRKLPCLWYQVDAGEADPASFFSYLGLAVRRAAPRKRRALPLLTPEYLPGLQIFTRRYFENLCERLPQPSAIVFDNYHELPATSPVHQIVASGLAQLPSGIAGVVISRTPPPPEFARLQASGSLAQLGGDELALNLGETLAIARLRKEGGTLPRATLQRLHALTGGWAAGVILMLARARTGTIPSEFLMKDSSEAVFGYFAREVFAQVQPDIQKFLLQTSFLPRISVRAAEQVTGRPDAERVLGELARGNHFTTRYAAADGPDQYRYHDLFRDFLLALAGERLERSELDRIRRCAAAALIAAGEVEDAVALLRDARAWDELAAAVLQQAPLLLRRGQHQTLAAWLQALPEDIRVRNGWLLYWLGAARFPFDIHEARSDLEQAYAVHRTAGDIFGQILAWSSLVDTVIPEGSDFRLLKRLASTAENELLRHYASLPEGMIRNRFASALLVSFFWEQPEHEELPNWAASLCSVLEHSEDPEERAQAAISVAFYYAWRGDTDRYDALVGFIRLIRVDTRATPFAVICSRLAEAALLIQIDRLADAMEAVKEGLRLAHESGVLAWNLWLHLFGTYCGIYMRDLDCAARYLAEAEVLLSPKRPLERAHHQLAAAWLSLIQGDASRARGLAEEVRRVAEEKGLRFQRALAYIILAQTRRACGEPTETVWLAASALQLAGPGLEELQRLAHLLLADFAFADNDEKSGLEHLRAALEMARRNRRIHWHYLSADTLVARLYARALQAGIEVEYTRKLLRAHRGPLPTPPGFLGDWPWPVRVSTLGGFSIFKDDQPLSFKGKAPRRPLELLKVLIALGGRDVREERLSEIIWPDAEGDAAHAALKTTLSRLRRLIGEEAVLVHGGRVGLNPGACWVDIWAADGLLAQAANLGSGNAEAERLGAKALGLYRGPFLGDDDAPWALPLRERMRAKVVRYVQQRAQYLGQQGQIAAAIEVFRHGLEIDPLAEELYCGLLKAHLALGQHTEANAVCERCRRTLRSVAGVEPSAETQALCRSLHAPSSSSISGRSVTDPLPPSR